MEKFQNIFSLLLKISLFIILLLTFLQIKVKMGGDINSIGLINSCSSGGDSVVSTTPLIVVEAISTSKGDKISAKELIPDSLSEKVEIRRWASDNPKIVSIDSESGIINSQNSGSCNILGFNEKDEAVVKVPVNVLDIKLKSIKIVPEQSTLHPSNEMNIQVNFTPENASNKSLKWESSDPSIVYVEPTTGRCVAMSPGVASVTASTKDGSDLKAVSSIVVQDEVGPSDINVSKVRIKNKIQTINVGENYQLKAEVYPQNAIDKRLIWDSSNKNIASISNDGLLRGLKSGSCTITVRSVENNKLWDTIELGVKSKDVRITKVKLEESLVINQNDKKKISVVITPTNATNKKLTWKSSNTKVAVVNNGLIEGVGNGSCSIMAMTTDGSNITATCSVTVNTTKLPNPKDNELSTEDRIKRYLSSFKNTSLAKDAKSLFSANAIVKIRDEGTIVNRRNASDYIDIVSSSRIIKRIKFVGVKINSNKKIDELVVEEEY